MNPGFDDPLQFWHPVVPSRELGSRPIELQLHDREIVLYRGTDGQPHALNNRCPHRQMRLALGHVAGNRIFCPYHGWNFGPDGVGVSPANPNMRVNTPCYAVQEHLGMVWLRHGAGGDASPPRLSFKDHLPVTRLFHRFAAPLDLILDNMTELEHTATVHSIFGFDTHRLHEVRSEVTEVDGGMDIFYEGPQRRLPVYLEWITGIAEGDRFVQHAWVRDPPLQATYDLHWFDSATGRQRPFSLKFVIFFNDDGPQAGTQTTYVFARAGNRLVRAVVRRFGWVLHHHINRELRADIRLVESLQIPPGPSLSGLTDRFDRPLVLRRRQHARRKAADNTTTPRDVPVTVTLRPQKQAAMHAHEK